MSKNTTKRIAIIGANSYIARNLCVSLDRTGHAYDLKLYDYQERHADNQSNYTQIDMLCQKQASQIDLDVDIIFLFTGKTGTADGFDNYNEFVDINEKSMLNILDSYRKQDSRAKIIFPSTRLVYKGSDDHLKESAEKQFKTIYSINKFACEQYLMMYSNAYDVKFCIFRICVPYGSLIPNVSSYGTIEFMLGKANKGENIVLYGDGELRRTFTYIGDLCDTLIDGALSENCANDIYNVGGDDLSLKEVATLISDKFQVDVEYAPWPDIALRIESGSTVFDSSKLDSILPMGKTKLADWVRSCKEEKADETIK